MADNRMAPVSAIEIAGGPGAGPVVTPQSTALMAQMFRQGALGVEDIVAGIDRHNAAKTQNAAAAMALEEAADPRAVALRGATRDLALAQTQGALAAQPQMQTLQDIQTKAAIWGAKMKALGVSPELLNTLAGQGFTVQADYTKDPTPEDAARVHQMARDAAEFLEMKKRELEFHKASDTPKQIESPDKSSISFKTWFGGRFLENDEINEARQFGNYNRAADWVKAGRPRPRALFAMAPGQVQTAPEPAQGNIPFSGSAGLQAAIQQRQAQSAPPVVAKQTAPATAAPAVYPKGATTPDQITTTFDKDGMTITFPPSQRSKDPTENQNKMSIALARMVNGEKVLDDLQKRGFDPTSFMAWIQNKLPNWSGRLKPQEIRSFTQAADNWIQGLLRLESGAAIAYKEQKWYVDTFFPQAGDGPALVAQKRQARQAMADFLNQSVGRLSTPGVKAGYEEMRDRLEQQVKYAAAGGQPIPVGSANAATSGAPAPAPVSMSGNRRLVPVGRDAQGQTLWDWEAAQ